MKTKICSKCKRELSIDRFSKDRRAKSGSQSWCKNCIKILTQEHREQYRQARKVRQQHSSPAPAPLGKKQCSKCKSILSLSDFGKDRYHKDGLKSHCKACLRARWKRYFRDNKEKLSACHAQWVKLNKDHLREYCWQYRIKNRERIRAKRRVYFQNHLEEHRLRVLKRRQLISEKRIPFDERGWLESQKPLKCYLCGKKIKEGQPYHIDHKIPLARGGKHASWNLAITCPECNMRKRMKTPWEYDPDNFRPELPL